MRQTLFAWLLSGLYRVLGVETPKDIKTSTNYSEEALYAESNRPLEQIINEGSLGKIENVPVKPTLEETRVMKLREEVTDLLKKYNPTKDLLVMNEERSVDLFTNDERIRRLWPSDNLIIIPGVTNIGIVKC
jgi:hypothetical protein